MMSAFIYCPTCPPCSAAISVELLLPASPGSKMPVRIYARGHVTRVDVGDPTSRGDGFALVSKAFSFSPAHVGKEGVQINEADLGDLEDASGAD